MRGVTLERDADRAGIHSASNIQIGIQSLYNGCMQNSFWLGVVVILDALP